MSVNTASTRSGGAEYMAQQHAALYGLKNECSMISLVNMSSYTTSQLSMQCSTGPTFFLLAGLESIFRHKHSTVQ